MSSKKYATPGDEHEDMPNLLGLTDQTAIVQAETDGFLYAAQTLVRELTDETRFDLAYIQRIHQLALGKLYGFAGRWRQVNISKGGFSFPPARFLDQSMRTFEQEFLTPPPWQNKVKAITRTAIAEYLGKAHAELLYIHPFRDGNGRTARLLAELMMRQASGRSLNFESIKKEDGEYDPDYIAAVHATSKVDYTLMIELFSERFLPEL